jgi:hypothetical protein
MRPHPRPPRLPLVIAAFASAVFVGGATRTAHAEPSKEDVARADTLFREAQVLVQKGQLSEGCAKFAESQRLDPANGTVLNLALCHEREGKFASAYRELQELLQAIASSKTADDRERTKVAADRLRVLEKKITRVTLDISELPKDASVTLDNEKVTDPAFPVPLDPGPHATEATAPHKKPGKKTFEVKEPGAITVKLDPLLDDAPPPPPPPPPPDKPAPPPTSRFWSGQRILGAVVAVAGLGGIAVGTVFGLDTFAKRDQRDLHCSGTICDAEGIRLHDAAGSSATISSIGFGAGAIALAVGAYLFIAAPSTVAAKVDTAARSPARQPGGFLTVEPMGLRGAF